MTRFRRPSSIKKAYWITLATRRLKSVLSKRTAAIRSQLEVKLSESGPPDQRPAPHILTAALGGPDFKRRRFRNSADASDPYIYSLASSPDSLVSTREDELKLPYDLYRMLVGDKTYCGDVLEDIVSASFEAVEGYAPAEMRDLTEPLEAMYQIDGRRVGVEAKNIRGWLYPADKEIWEVLRKCVSEDAQPLLVARKLHWLTFRVFSEIGAMGFEFHRQVYSERTAPLLVDIQHTDRLGFKDVIARPIEAYPPLVRFLDTTLRKNIPEFSRRWNEHRPLVEEYAVTRNLAAISDADRKRESADFRRELLGAQDEIDDYL